MTMTKQDRICMISLFAVMLVLMGVPALCLSTNTVVDELGTLTNTALLTGRNWGTGIISNGGFYYRYGMAFVWLLPFLIFKDPIMVYKAASFVNALFMATTPVMAYYISRRYLKIEKEKEAALLAAGSTIISSVMFQGIYLRGDMMLIVLNWVCALLILNAMYAKTRKERQIYTILLSFCAVYAYACHSRGIVMVIATAMTVLLIPFFTKEKERRLPYISFFGSMAVFLVIDKILVRYFKRTIWGSRAAHATGIPKESLELLTKIKGIKSYIRMAVGWLYNSFSSTLGLVCVGLIACVIIVFLMFRRSKKVTSKEGTLALFGFLSYAGSFVLGTVFFLKSVKKNFYSSYGIRVDRIVYDRYVCCAFGVLCMVALYVLVWKRDLFGIKAKLLSVAGCGVTLVLFARITAPYLNNQSFVRKYMGMLVTFVKTNAKSVTFKGDHVSSGVILFGVVALILFLLILFLCQKKKGYQACALTLLVSVLLFGYNVTNITISESNTREARISSASNLILSFGDIYKEYSYVWTEKTAAPIKSYQVRLMDYHLISKNYQGFDETDNVFVISKHLPDEKQFQNGEYYLIDSEDYNKKEDFVYVKGSELKDALEKRGVSLSAYTG